MWQGFTQPSPPPKATASVLSGLQGSKVAVRGALDDWQKAAHTAGMMSLRNALVVSAIWLATSALAFASDSASGTITFKTGKCAVKYGWLVRGPDEMDPSKTVLRIYLSSVDAGAKIKACKNLSCADNALKDGAMVDFSDAGHLAYAVRLNGERLQYSGGTHGEAFTLTTSEPNHLVGKLHIDDTAADGAKVDATFDLTLVNTFASVR
jgi:hypothetical protein